jgi:hypothetical protein
MNENIAQMDGIIEWGDDAGVSLFCAFFCFVQYVTGGESRESTLLFFLFTCVIFLDLVIDISLVFLPLPVRREEGGPYTRGE